MGTKRKRPSKNLTLHDPRTQHHSPNRNRIDTSDDLAAKSSGGQCFDAAEISHPVISLYYRQVVSLRQYILQRIPRSSKSRRRRIAAVRGENLHGADAHGREGQEKERDLANLLDTTLVGVWKEISPTSTHERRKSLITSRQSQYINGTDTGPQCPQSEILHFAISTLFNYSGLSYQRPQHLLSHGFQRASGFDTHQLPCSIPGVVAKLPNKNVEMLKAAPWTDVLAVLGSNGDDIMLSLLLDCGLFVAVDPKKDIYCQISGIPLSALEPIQNPPEDGAVGAQETALPAHPLSAPPIDANRSIAAKTARKGKENTERGPNAIVFCRQRLRYARPHLDSGGRIEFGLPNHVLHRFPSNSMRQTEHVLKYVFPRQFGLHNVFTSDLNGWDSALFKNYSSREEEIAKQEQMKRARYLRRASRTTTGLVECDAPIKIPKRLRGTAVELVRQLQNRNKRCSYGRLLNYYCPTEDSGPWTFGPGSAQSTQAGELASSALLPLATQPSVLNQDDAPSPSTETVTGVRSKPAKPKVNFTDHAAPVSSVSAFCRAVIRNLIPLAFLGTGQDGTDHQKIILGHVDKFVRMRRFESLSLQEICKGVKISRIPWLAPQTLRTQGKLSASDLQKRKELFHEFIYYVFDSILIPLIRGNFYVTESQVHRNRLFYFRHDVWRRLTLQPLAKLRSSMFEELNAEASQRAPGGRLLGYGSLRLLPKTTGIRPILNLRRRMLVETRWAGQTRQSWGQSVNSALAPILSMLNYEKAQKTDLLGSGVCSVGDIHLRLKEFKKSLLSRQGHNQPPTPLYFVKLDIQSCFDTIPQRSLVRLIENLVSEEAYHYTKYVEMRPGNEFHSMWPPQRASEPVRARRRFAGRIGPMRKPEHLTQALANGGVAARRNTVFVDTTTQKAYSCEYLLDLLDEHVRHNRVKIGKKYFRQRNGIPQGSVLSSILCNLFYAEMEREVLGFVDSDAALLLRLVDDFLLVTLDPDLAMRFLRVMIPGQPRYGISVNPAKSLVNFAASVEGAQIPRLIDTTLFPYCGSLIDTQTLELFKDPDRILDGAESVRAALSDSLTIESTRRPGRAFHRKILGWFKLSLHPMYLDRGHNSGAAVLSNLYSTFITSAMKMYRYARSLGGHPSAELVMRTIRDVIQLGHRLIRGRHGGGSPSSSSPPASVFCHVSYSEMQYLGCAAFHFVLSRKQTRYVRVVRWLGAVIRAGGAGHAATGFLGEVVRTGNLTYSSWRF
ncbi:hypothetical protein AOCH_006621 [Aspergillus ochraceoroseus]|uniref:Telomerase reverse transcriptase n=1 Tax=Aspergillus ochraceoroseus TaxID=138278 RepID=A0A0F8WYN8_9EURO|nr:hypothetical protein AOCH_006621 [Aspergillus ochraceoroseus]